MKGPAGTGPQVLSTYPRRGFSYVTKRPRLVRRRLVGRVVQVRPRACVGRGRMTRDRDPYAVVGSAMRDAIARAACADLSALDWRVFGAILAHTASYSRLEDTGTHEQIATLAGLDSTSASDRRRLRRSLRRLADNDVIAYEAGRGRPSVAGEGRSRRTIVGLKRGLPASSIRTQKRGQGATGKEDNWGPEKRTTGTPPVIPRRFSEKRTEGAQRPEDQPRPQPPYVREVASANGEASSPERIGDLLQNVRRDLAAKRAQAS